MPAVTMPVYIGFAGSSIFLISSGKNFLEIDNTLYKDRKNGYNDNSQKIRKYLSSPKEASRSAEAAFLGASAMFKRLF